MVSPDGPNDSRESESPQKADHYRHDDGTDEIVFAVEEGRVLTIREYPDTDAFERAISDAEHVGTHDGVAGLPGADAFADDQ
ncbi:hypothetical protein [Halorussus halophilus]|uniref:hypothetical protein n=1 Tax=Halorussus halophilus TaxID=2650975 RepID=UPI0013011336|nr:hypothetical protein [Halorussus halophilus]